MKGCDYIMTGAEFKKVIEHFGESNILGIGFDNSSAITFGPYEFSLANNYIEEIESIQTVGFDSRGNPFHTIKHVENIQSVIVRDANVPYTAYDRITLRG